MYIHKDEHLDSQSNKHIYPNIRILCFFRFIFLTFFYAYGAQVNTFTANYTSVLILNNI